jgi:RND family efflux transporter MFP subunit
MDTGAIRTLTLAPISAAGNSQWDGVIEAVQQADLTAQTGGRVAAVLVDVNDTVKANQVLLRLTGVEQRAADAASQAQVAAAKAQAQEAETTYSRYKGLAEKQYVSKQQVDQALAAFNTAKANVRAAQALAEQSAQQAGYTQIRAPFDAVVSARRVEPGESVATGQALISVFNPSQLRIQVQVPERIADALRRNPEAEILLADGSALPAERVLVYPSADADSHSVTVRLQLPDSGKSLKPGQVAKVVFASAVGNASLWIPETAVWRRGELSGVYVVTDKALLLRQLRLGESRDERIEVLSGVNAGERIAADPAQAALALAAFRAKQARSDGD